MGLTILLAEQDITDFVDEDSISIESVLGQGAGGSSQGVGSSSTASFLSDLGPIKSAIGAGQTVPTTYKQAVTADSPQGYWRLDSESSCLDLSGNSNTGTINGSVLTLVTSAIGDRNKAWSADGVTYITLPLALTSPDTVTLEALVYLNDSSAYGPVVCIGDWDTGYGFGIGDIDWDTGGVHLIARLGAAYKNPASPISLPTGEWVHVAVTFSTTTVTYYVNSVNSGTSAMSGNAPTGSGYIGATSNGKRAHNMVIDEVAGYSSVLSASRISAHYGAVGVSPALVRLGELSVTDATGTTIFGGYVSSLDDASTTVEVHTVLDCIDYFQSLDRIEVNEVFIGQTDIDILRYIITNYAPHILLDDIPATGTYNFDKRYVRAKSVMEALQGVAKVTGYAIWVTPDKKLQYKAPTDVSTAPFSLSDNPDFVTSHGYDLMSHKLDDDATVNRVYFYGGKNASADFTQDLSVQANGTNKVFQLLYYPHEASDGSVHVTVSGSDVAVGSPFSTDPNDKLISNGGTKDVLLNRDAKTLTFDVAPTAANNPSCTYRYSTPLVFVVSDRSSFQFFGQWYDGKLDDSSVLDSTTAIQRSRVLLAQQSYGLESLEVECHKGGLQAGMLLRVVNALRGIDNTYMIQKVSAKPLGSGYFEYTVSLGAWNWTLVDLLYASARRSGVKDDATEEDTTVIQAQETLEASTVVDVINLTTTTTGQYYSGNFYSGFATVS